MLDFSHIDRVAEMAWAKDIPREFLPVFVGVASLSEKAIENATIEMESLVSESFPSDGRGMVMSGWASLGNAGKRVILYTFRVSVILYTFRVMSMYGVPAADVPKLTPIAFSAITSLTGLGERIEKMNADVPREVRDRAMRAVEEGSPDIARAILAEHTDALDNKGDRHAGV